LTRALRLKAEKSVPELEVIVTPPDSFLRHIITNFFNVQKAAFGRPGILINGFFSSSPGWDASPMQVDHSERLESIGTWMRPSSRYMVKIGPDNYRKPRNADFDGQELKILRVSIGPSNSTMAEVEGMLHDFFGNNQQWDCTNMNRGGGGRQQDGYLYMVSVAFLDLKALKENKDIELVEVVAKSYHLKGQDFPPALSTGDLNALAKANGVHICPKSGVCTIGGDVFNDARGINGPHGIEQWRTRVKKQPPPRVEWNGIFFLGMRVYDTLCRLEESKIKELEEHGGVYMRRLEASEFRQQSFDLLVVGYTWRSTIAGKAALLDRTMVATLEEFELGLVLAREETR